MASSIQRRRGTTSDHATFTGAVGEITIDTTKDTVVVHDGAVVGGVPLLREDGSNSSLALGSQGVPSLKFSGDPNTGIYSPGADQLAVATNGVERVEFGATEVVFNDGGENYDFRIEGDTVDSLFFVDASADNVGIGTSSPGTKLDVVQNSAGVIASLKNLNAAHGYGLVIESEGTSATRYALILRNLAQNVIYGGVSTTTGQIGFWGLGASPAGTLGSRLTVNGGASIGGSYTAIAAPSNGAIIEGTVGIGTSAPNYQLHVTTTFAVGASGFNQQLTLSNDTIQSLLLGTGYTALKLNPLGGNVGIGATSPQQALHVNQSGGNNFAGIRSQNSNSGTGLAGIEFSSDATYAKSAIGLVRGDANGVGSLVFYNASSTGAANWSTSDERLRIDSSGRLLVGTSISRTYALYGQLGVQIESTGFAQSSLGLTNNQNTSDGASVNLAKTRGTSLNSTTIVSSDDVLGSLVFQGADGGALLAAAAIYSQVDGTATINAGSFVASRRYKIATVGTTDFTAIGASANTVGVIFTATGVGAGTGTATSEPYANSMPGRLVFSTTADGAASPTERMRITSGGLVGIGTTPSAWSSFTVLQVKNSSVASTGSDLNLMANAYYDGSNYRRIAGTAVGRQYFNTDGSIAWFQSGSGSADSTVTFSTPMTLDSSGRLLVGMTTNGNGALVQIKQENNLTSSTVTLNPAGGLTVQNATNTGNYGSGIWFNHGGLNSGIAGARNVTNNWGTDLRFYTHPDTVANVNDVTERMRITSGGLVGIGTTIPAASLDVSGGSIKLRNASSGTNYGYEVNVNHTNGVSQKMLTARYMIENQSGSYIDIAGINAEMENADYNVYGMSFRIGASLTERVRIDGSGRLLVGTSSAPTTGRGQYALQVIQGYASAPTNAGWLSIQRGQAASALTAGNSIGLISFCDNSGGAFAEIQCNADATPGTNDYPGQLVFSTTADGGNSPTERMRITSGGAVRIGSAISITPYDSLSSGTLSFEGSAGQLFSITNNLTTGSIFSVNDVSGIPSIDVNAAGTISLGAYGGNVGIGTSTPSSKLHVIGNLEVASANTDVFKIHRTGMAGPGLSSSIAFQVTQTNAQSATLASITAEFVSNWAGDLIFSTKPANGTPNNTVTEKMRITSDGSVLINATSTTGMATGSSVNPGTAIGGGVIQSQVNNNANQYWSKASGYTSGDYTAHWVNNTYVGGITTNGSSTSYVTSSDYRLKENVVPLTGAIDRINDLQVHRFNFIINPGHTVDGFLAHEAQAVVPECVTKTKDEVDEDGNPVYQGIDQSKLVPLLTAALQEAIAKIESLEARIISLEST